MNDDRYYPDVDPEGVWALELVLRSAKDDPTYLLESPYDDEVVAALQRIVGQVEQMLDEELDGADKWTRLEVETRRLFDALMAEQAMIGDRENAEKMAFFRTATSLLDKLVGIQERAANLKQVSLFHTTVLTVMEDILDAGQRTEVLERLKKAAGK